jgi:NAD(P)-dependent dehydrogenase (short-subunit alcohol dehydrogenase family)
MDLGLRERRVLVTAGAAGIGRVIAQRFLAEGALGECAAQTPGLLALCADVAVSADVGSLFARLQQKLWRSRRSGE